jgi:isoquinoline 1-oxidoreductase alpha subunit
MTREMKLVVNGRAFAVEAAPATSLLSVLRDHLGLTGSKCGCGEGQWGVRCRSSRTG